MTTGLEAFDKTVHKTNEWLGTVMHAMPNQDRKAAYTALRAVLHALRDRLPTQSAVALGAQLPMLVRGIYYDGWQPAPDGRPVQARNADEFLMMVELGIPDVTPLDAEVATRAVFGALERHLDPNEIEKVIHLLPKRIQELWRQSVEPRDS
jgi:uncharacterized protein (DUF2267 family)